MPDTATSPFTERGLSTAEVEQRIAEGKVNINTELKTKSVKELVIENVCTLFNLINLILAILVIITGAWKNLTFLGVVLLNTAIGIVQAMRSKRMVDKLTLLASKKSVALRDGREVELELDQIVLDDLIRLGRGDQIPADALVVEGECHVNESLLTGESNPIYKRPGDELMSGSFIDAGLILARVIHVGADNYVARINNEAKYVKKVNSQIMNALNSIVRFASVLMVPLGAALFFSSVHEAYVLSHPMGMDFMGWLFSGSDAWGAISGSILTTVGALLGMIPQGLVLLTSSVLAIATIRLARRNVLAQQLYCIETLARVDVLCLDKTGTITSGRMEVEGVYVAVDGEAVPASSTSSDAAALVDTALYGIAQATSADANETCTAVLNHYADLGVAQLASTRTIAFDSAKKWSGASFGTEHYVMGASQFVMDQATFVRYEMAVNRLADACRVLVIAAVDGFTEEGDMIGAARPLGFVTIRDEIRTSAPETISYFREQGVVLNVISGDDPRTVSSIARTVGIPGAEAFVDSTTLDTPSKLDAAVDKYHVFGRVTPQQKRELVVALQKRGHTVAMTGDGVNDVLALKEADCSVAMAAGSDAARNVAEIVLVDNDFASMPAVVAEGRRSINNLQRSAALFLTKTLFSMGLAAICVMLPPYPFEPITMTLINFFCIGFPSFVLALEPNHARVNGSFLSNVLKKALPASVGVLAASLLCIASSQFFGFTVPMLSTMCLIGTCSVGTTLIWRISVPFTPLRVAVLVIVITGICMGVVLFPQFFSIARVELGPGILMFLFAVVGCLLFLRLADVMERMPERATQRATGFGRGIRVSVKRNGRGKVSSTGTSAKRLVEHMAAKRARRERERALRSGRENERRSSRDASSRVGVPASPAKRSVSSTAADASRSPRAGEPRSDSANSKKKKDNGVGFRVSQSNGGIHVKMPSARKRKP